MGKYKINTRTGKFDLVGQGGGPGGPVSAAEVNYNDSKTGFGTGNVQGAIEALFSKEEILRQASEGFKVWVDASSSGPRKIFTFKFPHYSGDTNLRIVFHTAYRVDNEVVGLCSFLISCGYKRNSGTYVEPYFFNPIKNKGFLIKDSMKITLKKDPVNLNDIGELEIYFDFPTSNSTLMVTLGPRDEDRWFDFSEINNPITPSGQSAIFSPYEWQLYGYSILAVQTETGFNLLYKNDIIELVNRTLSADCSPFPILVITNANFYSFNPEGLALSETLFRITYKVASYFGKKGEFHLDIDLLSGDSVLTFVEDEDSVIFRDSENSDFSISDEEGNVLALFSEGHIKTKNFDSRETGPIYDVIKTINI